MWVIVRIRAIWSESLKPHRILRMKAITASCVVNGSFDYINSIDDILFELFSAAPLFVETCTL